MPTRKVYKPRTPERGRVILIAPDFVTSAAVGGVEYFVAEDGSLEIPAQFAGELTGSHGFIAAPQLAPTG